MIHFCLLFIIYAAFISLGLPDGVLGVAWPTMRETLGQPLASVGLITLVVTVGSAMSSFFSGRVLARLGTGSLNHFVSAHYSSRHMNWLHGFWGVGATLGPVLMGIALAGNGGWTEGYRTVALIQLSLASLLLLALPLWRRHHATVAAEPVKAVPEPSFKPVSTKALWLAPLSFLLYVAAEMGLWAASILVSNRGMPASTAGIWVSVFFGSITVGRFGVGLVANRLGNRLVVRLGIVLAIVGAALFALQGLPSAVSLVGLLLMGLGCAPVFPSLMHETARRFPPSVAQRVIGRQVGFAYVGGSVVPAACVRNLIGVLPKRVRSTPATLWATCWVRWWLPGCRGAGAWPARSRPPWR